MDAQPSSKIFLSSFPSSKFIINVRSNITNLVTSREKYFRRVARNEFFRPGFEESYYRNLYRVLGKRAYFLDMSFWKNNVSMLNDAVAWLGFESCVFSSLIHENNGGYGRDNSTPTLLC